MNSLPLISHHLFVAAIGNEGRAHEQPRRHEHAPGAETGRASAIALEVVDGTRPMRNVATRPLPASVTQARS